MTETSTPASVPETPGTGTPGAELRRLAERTRRAAADFDRRHGDDTEVYRRAIETGIGEANRALVARLRELTDDDPLCRRLAERTSEYVDWLQWSLWDLPELAIATRPDPEVFCRRVTGCGLVYLSIRLFDDVLSSGRLRSGSVGGLLRQRYKHIGHQPVCVQCLQPLGLQ